MLAESSAKRIELKANVDKVWFFQHLDEDTKQTKRVPILSLFVSSSGFEMGFQATIMVIASRSDHFEKR